MDRGFDKGPLLRWLLDQERRFLVRSQRGHLLDDAEGRCLNDLFDAPGTLIRQGPLPPDPGQPRRFPPITSFQKAKRPLHRAVSALLEPKTLTVTEWRLGTHLPAEPLGRVPTRYAPRMPPEELHRDSKRGFAVSGFGLCPLGRLRPDRLERLLVMFSVIYGFRVWVAERARASRDGWCARPWGL